MTRDASKILAELGRHRHCFDLDRDGLGVRLAETSAAAVFEYMELQIGPDNNPWVELSEDYADWKSRHFPGEPMAELYRHMKAPDQLRGVLDVTTYTVTQTYGLDDRARQEAVWFSEGNERQPARPFYALNDLAVAALGQALDDRFRSEAG